MLYVALGRNIGDIPMADNYWANFVETVTNVIQNCELLPKPDTVAYGESNFNGDGEETCVLVWFDKNSNLLGDTIGALTQVAEIYEQESIAYTVAVTEFTGGI